MAFIQRDDRGKVIGVYVNQEPRFAEEELPDDDPQVLEFLKRVGKTKIDFTPQFKANFDRIEKETFAIDREVTQFFKAFSSLESGLSNLLSAVINRPKSRLAHAIFFSPTGFDARVGIVDNAMIQVASEVADLAPLLKPWGRVVEAIDDVRNVRNAIAHGSQMIYVIRGKQHPRLSPPSSDVIRVQSVIDAGQIPGFGSNQIYQAYRRAHAIANAVNEVHRLLDIHNAGAPLPRKFAELEAALKKLGSP